MAKTIGLIGDFNEEVIAHMAIPRAIELSAQTLNINVEHVWVATENVSMDVLQTLDAIWCVPVSPYNSIDGALLAIKYGRENSIPFLGTCGGYQHAALEYARHVLGFTQAGNAEVDPNTEMPLISSLMCKLVEKTDQIILDIHSKVGGIYQQQKIDEDYHCSFGVNSEYLSIFNESDMNFVGHDDLGDPRVLELANHPFFIGTAYQPERSANEKREHPLITAFLKSVVVL